MKVETRCTAIEKLSDGGLNVHFSPKTDLLDPFGAVWFKVRLPPERANDYKLGDAVTFDVTLS